MTTAPVVRRTSTLSVVALVAAFVVSVAGVVLGILALVQIRRTGEAGRGLAIAAIVIGVLVTAFFIFSFALPYLLNAMAAFQEG
ncbi:MAG: conserved rane protein of unknown function [Rhodoglobus sp.]|nr:conserved rane protein of unknown function [Rhodoglobus sp.]